MKRNIYLLYAMTFLQGMVFYGAIATLYRQALGIVLVGYLFNLLQFVLL